MRELAIIALIALARVLWSGPAAASPSFPAAVDQALMLTGDAAYEKRVDPPNGCLLCHVVESGGNGTNNAFGHELLSAGVMPESTTSVPAALAVLGETHPRAIDDIRKGVNPNDDPAALGNAHVPQYGCGSIAGVSNARASGFASVAALALLATARRRTAARAA